MTKLSTLLTMIAILLLSFVANAQSGAGKVSGKVGDANQGSLAASIALLHAKDSSVARMTANDKNGEFEFENVQDGQYLLLATAVGYAKTYSGVFSISNGNSIRQEPLVLRQEIGRAS